MISPFLSVVLTYMIYSKTADPRRPIHCGQPSKAAPRPRLFWSLAFTASYYSHPNSRFLQVVSPKEMLAQML